MVRSGMAISDLDTPCLLVDLDRVSSNIYAWQKDIAAHGVKLRPHVKTHKTPAFALMQLEAGASGITVAKVSEAEVFAQYGCKDLFIAYPVIGIEKWRRAAELARACTLIVGVDSSVGAEGLSAAATIAGATILVRVEVDLGLNRSGVQPDQTAALCQQIMALPGLALDGIFTYRGAAFPAANGRSAAELACEEGELMVALAEQLRAVGIPIREVSLGSTPTGRSAAHVTGVTEVRPGTYIFGDYMTVERGAIGYDEVALSILCTVVSRPAPDKATIDGGSKTFCGDIFPGKVGLKGYAKAVDSDSFLESLSEEHGVVRLAPGVDPQVGDKLAFYPIHVCTTVNLSDELIGITGGRVQQAYTILARGKRA